MAEETRNTPAAPSDNVLPPESNIHSVIDAVTAKPSRCRRSAADNRTIRAALRILEEEVARYGPALCSPGAVRDYLRLKIGQIEHEVFVAIWLNAQNLVINIEQAFRGTITKTHVYPREIVKSALFHNAAAVIFAHNHPSGSPEPGLADRELTISLKRALALIEVEVLDHFVIGADRTVSFMERGLL